MTELHPISLCNVIFKCISKALANRLRKALSSVIEDTQSAFIPGKCITDNAMIGFECMHALQLKVNGENRGFMSLKLDMSKAYDRVEWSFLKRVMRCMGSDRWISIIMDGVTTVRYSFILNGRVRGDTKPSRDSGGVKKRKMYWCKWVFLCKDWGDRGMGFRDLGAFNKALMAKQCWRLLQFPHTLVARILKGCYFAESFLFDVRRCNSDSFILKSLMWGRELLEKVDFLENFHRANLKDSVVNQHSKGVARRAPANGLFKINTDVAVNTQDKVSGVGVVIRDSGGHVLASLRKNVGGCFEP
ncbi:hypothetical protein Ddye_029245 [Dipteronia dyeriana]|uniref:Reverse transcriptase domain-containing protein n=1 Tax=Dipteronia dyeriana TaxID=168575 RepID=A0AAD9TES4_9ROSI|nr:hypothetical protein Ddye_029245 [Dipteronia dyeriana]